MVGSGRIQAITHKSGFSGAVAASPVPPTFQAHFEGSALVFLSVYWGRGLRKHKDLEEKGAREDFVSLKCKLTCWLNRRQLPRQPWTQALASAGTLLSFS